MTLNSPNAKACPRCGSVAAAQQGVCVSCGRLFRTPLAETPSENRTMMFYDGALPVPPPAKPVVLPPVLRLRHWLRRMQTGARHLRGFFSL